MNGVHRFEPSAGPQTVSRQASRSSVPVIAGTFASTSLVVVDGEVREGAA